MKKIIMLFIINSLQVFTNDINVTKLKTCSNHYHDSTNITSINNLKIEASAAKASIAFAKMNKRIPKKYIGSYGTNGFMKGKPIISTAIEVLNFMKDTHKEKPIVIDSPCDQICIKKNLLGKQGLYLFIPNDATQFGMTGYVTFGDGEYKEKINKHFYMGNKGIIYLFK